MNETCKLIETIGTPYCPRKPDPDDGFLQRIYEKAFADRVALLYLSKYRRDGWADYLEEAYQRLENRRRETFLVVADLSERLYKQFQGDFAIFKSLKPYPATPNDTDVIVFGGPRKFNQVLSYLYDSGYVFHEWAPMQTTVYDPRGKGRVGKGKKGGTYYIDVYSEISTDYFLYIDKRALLPYVEDRIIEGRTIRNVRQEIELAIILFHNIFPERTFQLEHFYLPLYHLSEKDFNLPVFIQFAEAQHLVHAIATNLTIVEYLHKQQFGFVPPIIEQILDRWDRNTYELDRFIQKGRQTPYMISPRTFWRTFIQKSRDNKALKSLLVQGVHMLNPLFLMDVVNSLKNRFSEKGTYHLE